MARKVIDAVEIQALRLLLHQMNRRYTIRSPPDLTIQLYMVGIGRLTGFSPVATGQLLRGAYQTAEANTPGTFPILKSKGAKGQSSIESRPDEFWMPKPKLKQEENKYLICVKNQLLKRTKLCRRLVIF